MKIDGYKKNKYHYNKCNNLSNNIYCKNINNNCNNKCNSTLNSLFEIEKFLCNCNKAIKYFNFYKFFK